MTDTAQAPRERKRRSQTRWGPSPVLDKDGDVPAEPSEQPTDGGQQAAPAPQARGSDGKDLTRRKRTRWGPGDVKIPVAGEAQPPSEAKGPVATAAEAALQAGSAGPALPPLPSEPPPPTREGAGAASREADAAQLAEAYRTFKQEVGAAVQQGAQPPSGRPAAGEPSAEDLLFLYVGNVSPTVTEEGLTALFDSVVRGSLRECRLVTDPSTPYRHRGFALVRIADEAAARRALQLLHDYPLGGQNLVVRPRSSVPLSAQDEAAAASQPPAAWAAPPTSSAAAPAGFRDYYNQPGGTYPSGGSSYHHDHYPYSYPGGYPPGRSFGGAGGTGANATPVGPGPGYGMTGGQAPAAAPVPAAPATPPVSPGDRPPGTEDDPAYDYAYPSPDCPAPASLLASLSGDSDAGPDPVAAAAAAMEGLAHLAAVVKAEVARREEEGLLPPGVEAAGDYAAGQHPTQLFGAPSAQPAADAVGQYDAWGYDPQYGYWDGTTYYAYAAQEGSAVEAAAAAQQDAKPNLEPPRIKPRVPRNRQRKGAQPAAGTAAPAEAITVPLPADWEEKQKAKKMEEAAAKMAAAAAARAEAGAAAGKGEKAQAAGAGAGGPKMLPGPAKPAPARPASPRRLSPLRYSRSPSPRRPISRSPSRGRGLSRSPPPHLRYRSRSPYSRSPPRYHSQSPSPRFRGPQYGGRGRGRGARGRGGYPPSFRGRSSSPASPPGRGRGFDTRSPLPRRFSPSPRRHSRSPPPRRSPSPCYDDYRGQPSSRGAPRSRSPPPKRRYSSSSRSPLGRRRYGSPEGRYYASRSPPPRSPPSSPEEGELEEGEIELDPREARRLEQQQRRQPSPPPPRRGGYGRPPPPPYRGGQGRGGRGGGGYDYAGEIDFVSGQPAPMPAMPLVPLMGGGMIMPLGTMMGGGLMMMPGVAGRGGGFGGRGGGPGRGR